MLIFEIICIAIATNILFANNTNYMKGLLPITKEELEYQNKTHAKVIGIKYNKIAHKRIDFYGKNGLMRKIESVPLGSELEVIKNKNLSELSINKMMNEIPLPGAIDNSQLKFFPPIRSQGQLPSCAYFSGTYYAMTHMYALINNIDVKNNGDNLILSPKWMYNMLNNGNKVGGWYYWAYEIGMKHGCASWKEFPYDRNYREWSLDQQIWKNAIYRKFDSFGYIDHTNTSTGLYQMKQMLLNGYVLNFPTYIDSWNFKKISDDTDTNEDNAFVGMECCYLVDGKRGYHGMTVVGYNDHIWVDINENQNIDQGEKGALKIANSWGTNWKEQGFSWMAYDALRDESNVEGSPSGYRRMTGFYPCRAHWVIAKKGYSPEVIGGFTLKHSQRNELMVTLGVGDISETKPSALWMPGILNYSGGPYAFDGTRVACEGHFVFDFTELYSKNYDSAKRWFISIHDSSLYHPAKLLYFELTDIENNLSIPSKNALKTVDQATIHAWIDKDFSNENIAPEAVIKASKLSGDAPLTVQFDATESYDSDGFISRYQWYFGDGHTGSGLEIEHVFSVAGKYRVNLLVTDNLGMTDSKSVTIVATGYYWKDSDDSNGPVFNWMDISKTGTLIEGLTDDSFAGPFPIHFSFNFYGVNYTQFYVSSNGYIGFGPTTHYNLFNNKHIPETRSPNNIVAWNWDDLHPKQGAAYYQTIGNQLIVQFENYGAFSSDGTVNAEVVLNADGSFIFNYQNFGHDFDHSSATIGIENMDGTDGIEVAHNTEYLHDLHAIQFYKSSYENDKMLNQQRKYLEFVSIPAYGNRIKNLEGYVSLLRFDQYKIVVFIYVDEWRLKKGTNQKYISICPDSRWSCDITTSANDHTATKIAVYLMPKNEKLILKDHCKTLPRILFKKAIDYKEIIREQESY